MKKLYVYDTKNIPIISIEFCLANVNESEEKLINLVKNLTILHLNYKFKDPYEKDNIKIENHTLLIRHYFFAPD